MNGRLQELGLQQFKDLIVDDTVAANVVAGADAALSNRALRRKD